VHVSIVIPTYRRPESLMQCLDAIDVQSLPPSEVVVVCREGDIGTLAAATQWARKTHSYQSQVILVDKPGQIAALRRGVDSVSGDIVVFTDDDTVPKPDWIERLIGHYRDPMVGGVGGRDVINGLNNCATASRVGVITWYGKMIGNHHLGCRNASEVDVLKGANASFRRHLVTLPDFFRGDGAEVHNEVYICLTVRRLGYKLIYDPDIQVNHFPADRFDEDQRNVVVPLAIRNASFNFMATCLTLLRLRLVIPMMIYTLVIGHRGGPGMLRLVVGVIRRETDVIQSYVPCQLGLWDAFHFYLESRSTGGGDAFSRTCHKIQ
jgi:glycosyltransferase involved in cell wall biosynthesis